MTFLNLNGKKVFITGGTGGIGSACVKGFLHEGCNVAFTSSSQEKIHIFMPQFTINKNNDAVLKAYICEMNDFDQISSVSQDAIKECDGIDILVLNAGMTLDKLALRMDFSEWMTVINVNVNANFKFVKEFLRSMMSKKNGRVIFVSSIIASTGNAGQANYAASKSGLEGMMRSLALEFAKTGITFNAVAPGFIDTNMTNKLNDQIKETILTKIPMGYQGKPEDVFSMIAFLASSKASYITGQVFHVNGGMYLS